MARVDMRESRNDVNGMKDDKPLPVFHHPPRDQEPLPEPVLVCSYCIAFNGQRRVGPVTVSILR